MVLADLLKTSRMYAAVFTHLLMIHALIKQYMPRQVQHVFKNYYKTIRRKAFGGCEKHTHVLHLSDA
jgi:hypothetical protein